MSEENKERKKPLAEDNIPEDILYGRGTLRVFECHDSALFEKLIVALAGRVFHHRSQDGRMYIKCGIRTTEMLMELGLL